METTETEKLYEQARARARWMPAFVLRRHERRILARLRTGRPPTLAELALLGAVRRELIRRWKPPPFRRSPPSRPGSLNPEP
jgi:hypothetical protein